MKLWIFVTGMVAGFVIADNVSIEQRRKVRAVRAPCPCRSGRCRCRHGRSRHRRHRRRRDGPSQRRGRPRDVQRRGSRRSTVIGRPMTVVPNPPYPDGPPPVLPDPDPVPRPITPEPRPDEPPDPDQPPVIPDPVVSSQGVDCAEAGGRRSWSQPRRCAKQGDSPPRSASCGVARGARDAAGRERASSTPRTRVTSGSDGVRVISPLSAICIALHSGSPGVGSRPLF